MFKRWISGEKLKATRQRQAIVNIFLDSSGHKNLSQIHAQVVKVNPKIGYTTVYRTLKLLTRSGLAVQRKFADGETRYESASGKTHHDHLICLECGKITEFENEDMETMQSQIAQRYHFKISHHRMELYGQCADCRSGKKTPKKKR